MAKKSEMKQLQEENAQLQELIDRLYWSMDANGTWWECPKCHYYSKEGLICLQCGHDPSYDREISYLSLFEG